MSDDVAAIAFRLAGEPVLAIERVRAGGNNELFRVETAHGAAALKRYPARDVDPRDRLGREFRALTVMGAAGERAVPRAVAADERERCALYEWIAGERPARFASSDVDAALAFVRRLHGYRDRSDARALGLAEEACLDGAALVAQIEARVARYRELAGEPGLRAFLEERFRPAWERLAPTIRPLATLAHARRTLSPSDFGVHNTLRRPDGSLAFVDFEYFGWDDPVKLTADTLWHPGSAFDGAARERFRTGATAIFGDDPGFAERLRLLEPAYALRWALIVLAEFLPERWARRRTAGEPGAWDDAKGRQLAKAHDYVTASGASRS